MRRNNLPPPTPVRNNKIFEHYLSAYLVIAHCRTFIAYYSMQPVRVFCTSDVHIDYAPNMDWVRKLSSNDYTRDALIVAGDGRPFIGEYCN